MALSLDQRQMIPELMDAPGLDTAAHDQALEGLRRLNKASQAAEVMGRAVMDHVRQAGLRHVAMLDVACGGGDVPVAVAQRLCAAGVMVELTLMDRSATALALATRAAQTVGITARTAQGDAPQDLPEGPFDVVTNSLFLHHLARADVVATLREMARRTKLGQGCVIISDLRRSRVGYVLAWIMCRLLSRSRIVHHDGPVSVRAAWTIRELAAMAVEAGLAGAVVRPCWPWRMLLVWHNGGQSGGTLHGN